MKKILLYYILFHLACSAYSQPKAIVISNPYPHEGVYMGMYNMDGKEILPAKYGTFDLINKNLIHICNLNNEQKVHGVIDFKKKEVIPLIYNSISTFSDKYLITSIRNEKESEFPEYDYQITDVSGKLLSEKFDEVSIYIKYCIVKKDGLFGILDNDLNYIMPLNDRYSHIQSWDVNNSLFVAEDRQILKKALIIPSHTNISPFVYNQIFRYNRKEKKDKEYIPDNYYTVIIGEKFGTLDLSGKQLVPVMYNNIVKINERLLFVQSGKSDYGWGIFDTSSMETTPCKYHRNWNIKNGYIHLQDSLSRTAVYDQSGKEVIPDGNYIKSLQKGYWEISSNHSLWGVVDSNNKEILPRQYHFIDSLTSSLFRLSIDNRLGIADTSGRIILPAEYDTIEVDKNCNLLKVCKDTICQYYTFQGSLVEGKTSCQPSIKRVGNKYQIFDTDGKTTNILYNDIKWNRNGKLIVVGSYRYGVVDDSGNVLIPIKYRMIDAGYQDNSFNVCDTDNVWHLFTEIDGKFVNSGKVAYKNYNEQDDSKKKNFIHIYPITDKLYEVMFKDGTYGLADAKMKVLTTASYDQIWYRDEDNGLLLVEKGNLKGLINNKGKEIVPASYSGINVESAHGVDYIRVILNTKNRN